MKVRVDVTRCLGSGLCSLKAHEVFDQDDEGTVVLLDPHPPAAVDAEVRDAARSCPAEAIAILPG
ncbi:MAG TPA: ferredoxin [Streptosporangiaceae bacterium]|nr:ferredoxin [Streptosporangiaceae bacterium]